MKKQAETEAVMIGDMKWQVGEDVEQSVESEVKKEMFFFKEIQQDVIKLEDKQNKENVPKNVVQFSSEEAEMERE